MSAVNLQAFLEGLLPQRCAEQQGAALFQHLKQLWPPQARPVRHAQVLLLQARLTAPLGHDSVISLVQQALALLADQQVTSVWHLWHQRDSLTYTLQQV